MGETCQENDWQFWWRRRSWQSPTIFLKASRMYDPLSSLHSTWRSSWTKYVLKEKIYVALNVCGNKCTSSISLTIFSPWAHFALKSTLPWGMFPLPCNVKLCMVMTFKCSSQAKGGSIRKTEESLLCQCTVQCSGSGCQCDLGWRFRMNSWFIKTSTERFARLLKSYNWQKWSLL